MLRSFTAVCLRFRLSDLSSPGLRARAAMARRRRTSRRAQRETRTREALPIQTRTEPCVYLSPGSPKVHESKRIRSAAIGFRCGTSRLAVSKVHEGKRIRSAAIGFRCGASPLGCRSKRSCKQIPAGDRSIPTPIYNTNRRWDGTCSGGPAPAWDPCRILRGGAGSALSSVARTPVWQVGHVDLYFAPV